MTSAEVGIICPEKMRLLKKRSSLLLSVLPNKKVDSFQLQAEAITERFDIPPQKKTNMTNGKSPCLVGDTSSNGWVLQCHVSFQGGNSQIRAVFQHSKDHLEGRCPKKNIENLPTQNKPIWILYL